MLARRTLAVNPWRLMENELDNSLRGLMWSDPFRPARRPGRPAFPALNAWEQDEKLHIEAELPGFKMEDLNLLVTADQLTISGKRENEVPEETTYHRRERGVGAFERVVSLPFEVDTENVSASLRNGVLTIVLPKAPELRARRIPVKVTEK